MRKPCTHCSYNRKTSITPPDSSRESTWDNCHLFGPLTGHREMIANCVDYAEYLAWFRENRKKKNKPNN